ncbi:dual specificity phosphatase 28 [Ambystoma mexicanum]|uniref:dual specificity phosphatase 28 n=1 Tax=Ambystoma mexicanum TaxID=8296 RepID=UPI0037E77D7E
MQHNLLSEGEVLSPQCLDLHEFAGRSWNAIESAPSKYSSHQSGQNKDVCRLSLVRSLEHQLSHSRLNQCAEGSESLQVYEDMLQLCQVTESLLISNARSACNGELLTQAGVTLCINVSKQQPFPSLQLRKLRIPVSDDPSENLYCHFEQCFKTISDALAMGGKCLVYCKTGRSRSATVCIAYLMKDRRLKREDAFQIVKKARPVVAPNEGFWSQLEKYESFLRMNNCADANQ